MTAVCVVQARMGSTRLPGKVLMALGESTVLAEVLRRCALIPGIDQVCCAVPEGSEDDPVAEAAARAGAVVTRGSGPDVLARYARAARETGAAFVVRVTSDCPLLDPDLAGEVLDAVTAGEADYAANNMPPAFPHGLDCEAFTAEALFAAEAEATTSYEREHVTPWLREGANIPRAGIPGPGGDCVRQRWTLDWPEDLAFLQALFAVMPRPAPTTWRTVMRTVAAHPEIAALNAERRQR